MQYISTNPSSGVTIPELLVVISVMGILIGLIFGPFDALFTANSRGLDTIIQTTDTRSALRLIEKDITISSNFLSTTTMDINGNTPYVNSTSGWNWQGTPTADPDRHVLITENYAVNNSGELVLNTSCDAKLNIHYVYFVSGDTLYRRTLKAMPNPTGATNITGSCVPTSVAQKRTCRNLAHHAAYCQAQDAKIVSGVRSFKVIYYPSSTSSVALSNPTGARTVVLALKTVDKHGQEITSSLRISRMNGS